MELNWSTFVLEIINFLVLVWILKRFLYRPVLDVITRRRASIEKSLADAKALQNDAEGLQTRYQDRLAAWEQERQLARQQLGQDIESERLRGLEALQSELEQQKEKGRVAEERRQNDARRKIEEVALTQAARFASRLLSDTVGPELEARLVDLLVEQLPALPTARVEALRCACAEAPSPTVVTSAFPLTDAQRDSLEKALKPVTSATIPWKYEQDAALLAGVRITVGAWVLGANVQDELKAFAEFAHATHRA